MRSNLNSFKGQIVGRAGRKRNPTVVRERNGRAQRVYENPRRQVAEQPHRVLVPVAFREFQEAESSFGRMMILGHITPAQHEAGRLYAELAARYRKAIIAPNLTPSGIDLERVGCGGSGGMPDGTARAIKRAYDSAFESCGPHKVQRAIAHHVIQDRHVTDGLTRELLKSGLDKLVSHFGIDRNLQISSRHK